MKNLIGISGKLGSGKDTVGKIIQYLTCEPPSIKDPQNCIRFITAAPDTPEYENLNACSKFEIKKYADKLKDMTCLLLGCTREQLEDQDFKNTVLPEMWDKYAVEFNDKIEYIGSQEDANKVFDHYVLNLKIDSGRIKVKKIHLTPRLVLQQLGTDCGRDIIHTNIWVNSLFADYKHVWNDPDPIPGNDYNITYRKDYPNTEEALIHYGGGSEAHVFIKEIEASHWVITDMRFENELEGIKARGGITIRVNRDTGVQWTTSDGANEHPSETALDNAEFDYVINNDGSLEDLILSVAEILKKEGVITWKED
jgi:hypothetical protein